MTWKDVVDELLPESQFTEEDMDYILWNETAYPFCTPEHGRQQIIEYLTQPQEVIE